MNSFFNFSMILRCHWTDTARIDLNPLSAFIRSQILRIKRNYLRTFEFSGLLSLSRQRAVARRVGAAAGKGGTAQSAGCVLKAGLATSQLSACRPCRACHRTYTPRISSIPHSLPERGSPLKISHEKFLSQTLRIFNFLFYCLPQLFLSMLYALGRKMKYFTHERVNWIVLFSLITNFSVVEKYWKKKKCVQSSVKKLTIF